MHLAPGNPLQGEKTSASQLATLTHAYGLDKPLYEQYWNFLVGAVHLDFGESFVLKNQDVTQIIWSRFTVTAELALAAFAIMVVFGIGFGTLAGIKQNTWIDYTLTGFSILFYSVPSFILGLGFLILSVFFHNSLGWDWWPVGGWGDISKAQQPTFLELFIPAFGYGIRAASIITRLTRSQIVETKSQDYVRTAQAKGISGEQVTTRHVLRNALLPVASVVGDSFGGLLVSSVIWETIFQIPGLGTYFVSSILNLDYTVIMGTTVFFAFIVAIVNLAVDLIYAVLDPRIKYTTRSVA
jgi:oligopeptide transport system permease protein